MGGSRGFLERGIGWVGWCLWWSSDNSPFAIAFICLYARWGWRAHVNTWSQPRNYTGQILGDASKNWEVVSCIGLKPLSNPSKPPPFVLTCSDSDSDSTSNDGEMLRAFPTANHQRNGNPCHFVSFWCSPASSSASHGSLGCFWHTQLQLDWTLLNPHTFAPSNPHASLGFLGSKSTCKQRERRQIARTTSKGGNHVAPCKQASDDVNLHTHLAYVFLARGNQLEHLTIHDILATDQLYIYIYMNERCVSTVGKGANPRITNC